MSFLLNLLYSPELKGLIPKRNSALFPEVGTTELTCYMCASAAETGACLLLFLPQLLLEGNCLTRLWLFAEHRTKSTDQIWFVGSQGHLFRVLDGVLVNSKSSLYLCLEATQLQNNAELSNLLTAEGGYAHAQAVMWESVNRK